MTSLHGLPHNGPSYSADEPRGVGRVRGVGAGSYKKSGPSFIAERYGTPMQKVPMTQQGYDRMVEELKQLKTVERPAVIKAIAEARGHGDLSENAEYHAARDRQGFIEGRVAELEDKVSRAEIISIEQMGGDSVKFGASVVLVDEDTDQESRYRLVGEDEADIKAGLLSVTSPLSRALIAKAVGDTVEVTTPHGHRGYEIIKIAY